MSKTTFGVGHFYKRLFELIKYDFENDNIKLIWNNTLLIGAVRLNHVDGSTSDYHFSVTSAGIMSLYDPTRLNAQATDRYIARLKEDRVSMRDIRCLLKLYGDEVRCGDLDTTDTSTTTSTQPDTTTRVLSQPDNTDELLETAVKELIGFEDGDTFSMIFNEVGVAYLNKGKSPFKQTHRFCVIPGSSVPTKNYNNYTTEERRRLMTGLLNKQAVSVKKLREIFDVAATTVRKDFGVIGNTNFGTK